MLKHALSFRRKAELEMAKTIDEQSESILVKFGVFHNLVGAPREAMREAIKAILLEVAREQREKGRGGL